MKKAFTCFAILFVLALLAWAAGPTIQAGSIFVNLTQLLGSGSGAWTFRANNDNVVGAATTDTLTHKTFDTAGAGNVFKINGVAISSVRGNTARAQLNSTFTSGNFASFDANGNTVDSGIAAAVVNNVVYSTQSAATAVTIGPTTMITVAGGNHTYRVTFMLDQSNLGIGCSADTTITTTVGWRDPFEAANSNGGVAVYDLSGNGTLGKTGIALLNNSVSVAGWGQAFQALNGTNITYTLSIAGDVTCGTKPKVTVQPILELLN